MKKIILMLISICLLNCSSTSKDKTLDDLLEKHKGKEGISEIKALVDKGINAKDKESRTALIAASMNYGYSETVKETVKVLIESGAKVNAKDNDGNTALYWVSKLGHTEIVELLKAAGAKE